MGLFSVIWKHTEFNFGFAYDESTGVFTCPYNGIYSFYATSPIGHGNISIYVNGSEYTSHLIRKMVEVGGDMELKHISPYSLFELQKGDTVHIQMSGNFYHPSSEYKRTYFQGNLIHLL